MARSKELGDLGDKIDLSHLGQPFSQKTLASENTQNEAESLDIADSTVELYDVEKIKKKIIVLFMERMLLYMLSPRVTLDSKVKLGLAAMAQWEGTRKIIEWDKRVTDEKDLLNKADKLGEQILKYSKNLSNENVAKLQIKAAESILKDLQKEGEKTN